MLDATLLPFTAVHASLRLMHHGDATAYAQGAEDPVTRAWAQLPEPRYTPESVTALIAGPIAEGLANGTLFVLTIADPDTDEFAGSLVLFNVADTELGRTAEVGFWVHPAHRGKGRARAALFLAAELARRSGIEILTARTIPENTASARSLEGAGFRSTGEGNSTTPAGATARTRHYSRDLTPEAELRISTDRLILRPHKRADTEALYNVYRQPGVARYLLEEPWSPTDADRQVAKRLPQVSLTSGDHAVSLVIEHDGRVVGDVQLWLTEPERGQAEIGWVLDPAAGGSGLATEAVSAVLTWAFETHKLHRIVAQLDARNTASARLAQRVGLRREAHFLQNWWSKGEWTDTLVYAALQADLTQPGHTQL